MKKKTSKLSDLEKQHVAANPNTDEPTLLKLLSEIDIGDVSVYLAILQNKTATKKVFFKMLASNSAYVQWRTATELINRFIKNKLQLTDNELIELAQIANAYKQSTNFVLLSFVQDVIDERERYLYCFDTENNA